jgi:uncharacterized membrane protein YphA (DoxX/SURF4 family)
MTSATSRTTDTPVPGAPASSSVDRPAPGRKARAATAVLQYVLAATYLMAGAVKVTDSAGSGEGVAALGLPYGSVHAVGAVELAAGLGLLVPLLAGLAALALVPFMAGAAVVTFLAHGPGALFGPVAALVLVAVLARLRRGSTAALARRLSPRRTALRA